MALICNTAEARARDQKELTNPGPWMDNECYIEAGSAYFARAYAEALGMTSDIELHNPAGAELRLQSMAFLLDHALKQYDAAMKLGTETGQSHQHEQQLREAGLDFARARQVLNAAAGRELRGGSDELIEILATTFVQEGYPGLMSYYLDKVRELHAFIVATNDSNGPGLDAVAWQELGWRLTTLFAWALEVGKSIAILNTLTFRLPVDAVTANTH